MSVLSIFWVNFQYLTSISVTLTVVKVIKIIPWGYILQPSSPTIYIRSIFERKYKKSREIKVFTIFGQNDYLVTVFQLPW